MPKQPTPSAHAGPVERGARAGLPNELQLGFDKWMEDIRARGGVPEKVLAGKPAREVERVSQSFARKHAGEVARAEEAAYLRERAADNPLRPILKNVKQVGERAWIHYETQPPSATEIAHALRLSERTGSPRDSCSITIAPGSGRGRLRPLRTGRRLESAAPRR
jgi:hypothetical protein